MRKAVAVQQYYISIHALREEGDSKLTHCQSERMYFYPRPPRGGRLSGRVYSLARFSISIHALREEGDLDCRLCKQILLHISIHALREEGDPHLSTNIRSSIPISIHALREEGDEDNIGNDFMCSIFLSTPSARRATTNRGPSKDIYFISIHALREEGDCLRFVASGYDLISIHALREEGDHLRGDN